jgi:nitroreductase/NAD-dependent dihydropyrimidine dehydrogenase PreA subunit
MENNMNVMTVNKEKCYGCGICAEVCSMGIIKLKGAKQIPSMSTISDQTCLNCGQCVAVCPKQALSLQAMPVEECPPVKDDDVIPGEKLLNHFRTRRSIRTFKNMKAEPEKLREIIEIARYAPTVHNSQRVNWTVISKKSEIKKMTEMVIECIRHFIRDDPRMVGANMMHQFIKDHESGRDSICRNAPHIILTHALNEGSLVQNDCVIALSYLELLLPSFGLGGCWAGYFNLAAMNWAPLQKALKLPENHMSFGAMLVGYPKYKYYRLPLRKTPDITWI